MSNMAGRLKKKLSAKNVTAMILFSAIILVFVFFGLRGSSGSDVPGAARVNESLISIQEFQSASDQMEEMYAQYMGGKPLDEEQRKGMRAQTLERLIYTELTAQAARRAGIRATDVEIRNIITKDITAFQKDGQFQREYYLGYLQNQRMTAGDFENRIRKQLEGVRLRRLFEASSYTLSLESEKQKLLRNSKMNLHYVKLEDRAPVDSLVSATEVQKALENPEFAKKVSMEFDLRKANLGQKEQVRAQHILIAAKDPGSEKAALDKIKDIQQKAQKEDFGTLAQKFSEDPGSKAKKGDLGFFSQGNMVKEFEETAFALNPGQISEPVKSPFGYHLIKVLEKKPAKDAVLTEHQTELAKELLAKDKWSQKVQDLEKALAENPTEVDAQVKALGLKWQDTGIFSLSEEQVPKIQGLEVERIATLTPSAPWMKTLYRGGDARYLVKLLDSRQDTTETPSSTDEALQRRRADGIFTTWLQGFRKDSTIETNQLIFQ